MINRFLHTFLLSVRATDIASELLLELSLPLVTFFLAEEVHVSGIIAVVVAGILKASRFKKITLLEAQVDTGDRDSLAYSDLYAQRFCLCDFRDGVGNDSRAYFNESNL